MQYLFGSSMRFVSLFISHIKSVKMKTLMISAIIFASFSLSAKTDYNKTIYTVAVIGDTAQQSSLSKLLSLYYDIRNSLVTSDANSAATKAGEFAKAIGTIHMNSLPDADMKIFMSLQNKLTEDAKHIANTTDISHQREHFATFSANMIVLAKGAKLSAEPIYEVYCPMKKTYWLSSETSIKNPYFGNQMLTCGKVTETFK